MNVKLLIAGLLFVATPLASMASDPTSITSDAVLTHIKSVGAKQTVADYFLKPEWAAIKSGIASGNNNWLKVYASLEPVADGEAGEDLSEAVSDAIPVQPFMVLPMLVSAEHVTVEQLCTFTFEAKIPSGGVNAYLTRLEKALRKADNGGQREIENSCQRGIAVTRSNFKSSPNY
jgi:hypothetical protein